MVWRIALIFFLFHPMAPARADVYAHLGDDGAVELSPYPAEGFQLYMKSPPGPVAPAPPVLPSAAWDENTPYAKQVRAAAQSANVQPELIHAVIAAESKYRPAARSPAGAVGLMQLMPEIARRYNVKDRLDPQQNIHGGARYLRDLLDLFKNNVRLVLAAYNAGEHAVVKYGNRIPPFGETRAYVPKVMDFYNKLISASAANTQAEAKADATDLRAVLPQARVTRIFPPNPALADAGTAH